MEDIIMGENVNLIDGHIDEIKQTNYERIKAMSIDEMAKFLIMVGRLCGGKTPTNVKQWLEQEVET